MIGDVLREQAGDDVYELVERVRAAAVRNRRADIDPIPGLQSEFIDVEIDAALDLIRAFGWLSLLANTAEDLDTERRRRYHRDAGSQAREGSLAFSLDKLAASGVDPHVVARKLAELYVSPVITAHPTEVRRQTVLDHVDAIAALLTRRQPGDGQPNRGGGGGRTTSPRGTHVVANRRSSIVEVARARRDQRGAALLPVEHFRNGPGVAARPRTAGRRSPPASRSTILERFRWGRG